jgi:hypothetical protein
MRRIGFSMTTTHRHRALLVCEFLANHNMLSLPHPPYSTDLDPADFFLFPKLKMQLRSCRFHTVAKIQRESQTTTHTWSQKHQYNNSQCEHSNVSWCTALSRLKVIIAASATLCCHLLAHYRASPETSWYTPVYILLSFIAFVVGI